MKPLRGSTALTARTIVAAVLLLGVLTKPESGMAQNVSVLNDTAPGGAPGELRTAIQDYAIPAINGGNDATIQLGVAGVVMVTPGGGLTPFNPVGSSTLTLNGPVSPGTFGINAQGTPVIGVSSGTLSFRKTGSGTLSLEDTAGGNFEWNGTTTVDGGTLQLSSAPGNNYVLPNTLLVVGASGTFDLNGNLQQVKGLSGAGAVTLGAGTLTVWDSESRTYSGTIGGTGNVVVNSGTQTLSGPVTCVGSVTKSVNGVLVLNGNNSYLGGTTISGGTIQANSGSSLGAQTGRVTFAGVGNSTLEYTDDANESAREYMLAQTGTIAVNPTFTATLGGDLSGGSVLIKDGGGTLRLTGSDSGGIGGLTARAGILRIDGDYRNTDVLVNSPATLTGIGQIRSAMVETGGTVGPGSSIGTLTVNSGSFTLNAGSVHQNEVAPNGVTDLVNVVNSSPGAARVGGTLAAVVTGDTGKYKVQERYTIVRTDNGTGIDPTRTYEDHTISDPNFAIASIDYFADMIQLVINRTTLNPVFNSPDMASALADDRNASAVAVALSTMYSREGIAGNAGWQSVLNSFIALSTQERCQALHQLAPHINNAGYGATIDSLAMFNAQLMAQLYSVTNNILSGRSGETEGQTVGNAGGSGRLGILNFASPFARLDHVLGQVGALGAPAPDPGWKDGREGWLTGMAVKGSRDGSASTAGYDFDGGGFLMGRTFKTSDRWTSGVHAGYLENTVRQKQSTNTAGIENYQVGVHGSYRRGRYHMDAALGYTKSEYSTIRNIAFGDVSSRATGSFNGHEVSAYVQNGWLHDLGHSGQTFLEPQLAFHYRAHSHEAYDESGSGILDLNVHEGDLHFAQSALGLRLFKKIEMANGGCLVPDLVFRWSHEFGDVARETQASFVGSNTIFVVDDRADKRNSLEVRAGLARYTRKDWAFDASYNGRFTEAQVAHAGVARVSYHW